MQQQDEREARRVQLQAAMAAQGLEGYMHLWSAVQFIHRGEGSEAGVLVDARAAQQAYQQARDQQGAQQAQQQQRQRQQSQQHCHHSQ